MAHTRDWNVSYEGTPSDISNVSSGDDRVRDLKTDIRERIDVDHYMDLSGTQADHGEHRKVTFHESLSSDPSPGTGKGALYTKDVDSKPELHYQDEDGNVIQLTTAGSLAADIQRVYSTTTSATQYSLPLVPEDDTIPQFTEGISILSANITPKSTSNYLHVSAMINFDSDTSRLVFMLGQTGESNVHRVAMLYSTYTGHSSVYLRFRIPVPSASAITLHILAAAYDDTGKKITINGVNGSRYYGGAMESFMEVIERAS